MARKLAIALALCLFIPSRASFGDAVPGAAEIVDRMDRLFRSATSASTIEMEIVTPDWRRTLRMEIATEGMDKTFIRLMYPNKEKGVATLRIGTEMWNFFPRINKVMKVPPSMMMSSWMGSDFTNDDLVKESSLRDDYTHELVEPEGADPRYYYLELVPREGAAVVWGKVLFTVLRDGLMPEREEFFDERGALVRVMTFGEVRTLGGRRIPTVLEMQPLTRSGHSTVIRYIDAEFDMKLPVGTFTLRNLEKRV
jgi:outer membrane lipoprotein-sorting protein